MRDHQQDGLRGRRSHGRKTSYVFRNLGELKRPDRQNGTTQKAADAAIVIRSRRPVLFVAIPCVLGIAIRTVLVWPVAMIGVTVMIVAMVGMVVTSVVVVSGDFASLCWPGVAKRMHMHMQ